MANSTNTALKAKILPQAAFGEVLGGTGQSNSMKSCCGIEEARLKATKVQGGWKINGTLPWSPTSAPITTSTWAPRLKARAVC